MSELLLEVDNLQVHFPLRKQSMFAAPQTVRAVDGVSFAVARGRTFGIVGESGSGKTTTALAVMRLIELTAGEIRLAGQPFSTLQGEALRSARHKVQMIFQDPYSSLNPRMRAGAIVREPMQRMNVGSDDERRERGRALFEQVGLRPDQMDLFPHQFSGGQRQRIGIARALATKPELVVCDEPVSALDVAIQAQILILLGALQKQFGLTYLFISHDLGVVQYLCDEVAVMYLGQVVEYSTREALFEDPLHPYTWALLSAVPRIGNRRKGAAGRIRLEGDPPSPINPPPGCRFSARCPFAEARCRTEAPALREVRPGQRVACHLVREDGSTPHRPALL